MEVKGKEPNLFHRAGLAMLFIQFAPPLGLSYTNPVGGLIRGAGKARAFHETFQQERPVPIVQDPIGEEWFYHAG